MMVNIKKFTNENQYYVTTPACLAKDHSPNAYYMLKK